jgi:hypothetical protein
VLGRDTETIWCIAGTEYSYCNTGAVLSRGTVFTRYEENSKRCRRTNRYGSSIIEQLQACWPQKPELYGANLAKLRPQRHRGIIGSIALYNMVQCWHGTLKNTVPIHNMSSNAVPTRDFPRASLIPWQPFRITCPLTIGTLTTCSPTTWTLSNDL